MIVLLSGTSGSGKTYIVEQLLKKLGPYKVTLHLGPKDKLGGYHWFNHHITVMGEYTQACGGCDRISWKGGADDIEKVVIDRVKAGDKVILEGLLVGTWGVERMKRLLPYGLIVIQLSTPPEVCVAAVEERRRQRALAAGKEPTPLNPANSVDKFRGLLSVLPRRRGAGIPVELLNREEALTRVLELML